MGRLHIYLRLVDLYGMHVCRIHPVPCILWVVRFKLNDEAGDLLCSPSQAHIQRDIGRLDETGFGHCSSVLNVLI